MEPVTAVPKKEKKEMTLEEMHAEFKNFTAKSVDEQSQAFLRAFVSDFAGK